MRRSSGLIDRVLELRGMHHWSLVLLGLLFAIVANTLAAAEYHADARNYVSYVEKLAAGDTLLLAPGIYTDGLTLHNLRGYRSQPITIRALDPKRRPHFYARDDRNTVSISNSEYIRLDGLVLDGRGFDVDAVKAEGDAKYAHNITLENLLIIHHGATQQTVGISTKCPAWGWVIRGNEIVAAGTGMYFGDSDGSAPFVAGLIENNLVRDTTGYNIQIKHQKPRPDNAGLPVVKMVTVIRRNTFSKAQHASTGEMARPNVLVGKPPVSGAGSEDVVLIYGNFFHRNSVEALFQGEGNLAIYSNVFWNPEGSAIHIQPHKGTPDNVEIFHNTIVAKENGIKVIGGNPNKSQRVFGNAVFAATALTGVEKQANVIGTLEDSVIYLRRPIGADDRLDFSPKDALRSASGSLKQSSANYVDADRDFESRVRDETLAGAFVSSAVKWRPKLNGLSQLSSDSPQQ